MTANAKESWPEYIRRAPLEELVALGEQMRDNSREMLEQAADLERVVVARMREEGATVLDMPEFESVKVEPRKIVDVRLSELLQLRDIIPEGSQAAGILKKALWEDAPAPAWKTNRTYLKQLARFGGEIGAIIARGVVESVQGYSLVVRRHPAPRPPAQDGPA